MPYPSFWPVGIPFHHLTCLLGSLACSLNCLSVSVSMSMSLSLSLSLSQSVSQFVCLCLSVCLSVSLPARLPVYVCLCLSVCVCVCLSLSVFHISRRSSLPSIPPYSLQPTITFLFLLSSSLVFLICHSLLLCLSMKRCQSVNIYYCLPVFCSLSLSLFLFLFLFSASYHRKGNYHLINSENKFSGLAT